MRAAVRRSVSASRAAVQTRLNARVIISCMRDVISVSLQKYCCRPWTHEVGNDDSARVGQDVRHHRHPSLGKNDVGLGRRGAIGRFHHEAGFDGVGVFIVLAHRRLPTPAASGWKRTSSI
jgi:hypothetical protein